MVRGRPRACTVSDEVLEVLASENVGGEREGSGSRMVYMSVTAWWHMRTFLWLSNSSMMTSHSAEVPHGPASPGSGCPNTPAPGPSITVMWMAMVSDSVIVRVGRISTFVREGEGEGGYVPLVSARIAMASPHRSTTRRHGDRAT